MAEAQPTAPPLSVLRQQAWTDPAGTAHRLAEALRGYDAWRQRCYDTQAERDVLEATLRRIADTPLDVRGADRPQVLACAALEQIAEKDDQ